MSWVIDPEILMEEVESRPVLYAKVLPDYSNKSTKNAAWKEISKRLSEDWEKLTNGEKNNRCREVQAKWKHIRDNFRREYQAQNFVTSTQGAKKRKKYRYYDRLLFLAPHVRDARTPGNYNSQKNESEQTFESQLSASSDIESSFAAPPTSPPTHPQQTPVETNKETNSIFGGEVLKALRNDTVVPDEDITFCLSLVHSLKKMDDENKLSAKIEMLNVIRRFSFHQNRSFSQIQDSQSQHSMLNHANIQPYFSQLQPTSIHEETKPQALFINSVLPSKEIGISENDQDRSLTSTTPIHVTNPSPSSTDPLDSKMVISPPTIASSPEQLYSKPEETYYITKTEF